MNRDGGSVLETELEQVRDALAAWRAEPGKGQRIPDALWRKAVRAAKRHGMNSVSKALGLDYNCLKKHVSESGRRGKRMVEMAPAFVEVKTEAPHEDMGCVIELEKGGGTRMRICVKSAGSVDWCRIKEAFLGSKAIVEGPVLLVACPWCREPRHRRARDFRARTEEDGIA